MVKGARGLVGPLVTLLAVATWAAPTASGAVDRNPVPQREVTAGLLANTVKLVAIGCRLSSRDGTAVAVAGDRLLTNRHVAGDARLVDVAADGRPTVVGTAAVAASGADVAIVDPPPLGLHGIALAGRDARAGAAVTVAGYAGRALVIRRAHVVDVVDGLSRGQPSGHVLRLDVAAQPGMSGGPVVDAGGRLVGLVYGNETPGDHAVAIPVSTLRAVLQDRHALLAGGC